MFRFLLYLLRHKWFILIASVRLGGIPLWSAIVHDWSKLLPIEARGYIEKICGEENIRFPHALLHHWNHSPHHYQYWIARTDHLYYLDNVDIENNCFLMPERYIREMIIDWLAAGRLVTGQWDFSEWADVNLPKMQLHPFSRLVLMKIINEAKHEKNNNRWFHNHTANARIDK